MAPAARLFVGPEAAVGAFFPTGGDRSVRFPARGSAFVALGFSEQLQIAIAGDGDPALVRTQALDGGVDRGAVHLGPVAAGRELGDDDAVGLPASAPEWLVEETLRVLEAEGGREAMPDLWDEYAGERVIERLEGMLGTRPTAEARVGIRS